MILMVIKQVCAAELPFLCEIFFLDQPPPSSRFKFQNIQKQYGNVTFKHQCFFFRFFVIFVITLRC